MCGGGYKEELCCTAQLAFRHGRVDMVMSLCWGFGEEVFYLNVCLRLFCFVFSVFSMHFDAVVFEIICLVYHMFVSQLSSERERG